MGKLYVLNGPEIGQSFKLRDGVNFVGRSLDNDVQLTDKTVSRKHLRIIAKEDKYFIRDLKSRNGTLFNGKYISPGMEVEVKGGVPIAIGITMICFGERCTEQIMPYFDSTDLTEETDELNRTLQMRRDRVSQERLRFLYNASKALTEDLSTKETLEKILVHIFDLLKKIDRGVFVLIDPETKEITEVIYRSNKPSDDATTVYCKDVINKVIESRKPFIVSGARTEESEIPDTLELLKLQSVMCVPLISRSKMLGAIYVDSLKRPYGFGKEDLALIMNLSQRIAPAIEDARVSSEALKATEDLSKPASDS